MPKPGLLRRLRRHAWLTRRALDDSAVETPPLLVLFINSICNLKCEHCFYWRSLNQRDDLTFEELERLSLELGPVENLNLSGGEPFIREDFAEIVRLFVRNNATKQVYVPTSGYFTDRTRRALRSLLKESSLQLFACELSLDGTEAFHDEFRGDPSSFRRAMETYDMLAELQREDQRLRIHAISTATNRNLEEIARLTDYLLERCPRMDHHNLAVIRGDRKNPDLLSPDIDAYGRLFDYIRDRWWEREKGRFGGIVEPMLQWAKMRTMRERRQVIPCRAGVVAGVVYANGDVSVCELHEPIGNLRQASFRSIWSSEEAVELRGRIAAHECWCTTEVFLWPSIVFQPTRLARALVGAKVWQRPRSESARLPIVHAGEP